MTVEEARTGEVLAAVRAAVQRLLIEAWVGLGSSLHLVSFGPFDNAANAVSGTTRTLRGEIQAMAALVASLSFPFSAR